MLEFSTEEIKSEENWQDDPDFQEAVEDNWAVIVRLSADMKEKVLRLYELKYHPEDTKIEELLNIDRIETREARAKQELGKIRKAVELKLSEKLEAEEEEGIYL